MSFASNYFEHKNTRNTLNPNSYPSHLNPNSKTCTSYSWKEKKSNHIMTMFFVFAFVDVGVLGIFTETVLIYFHRFHEHERLNEKINLVILLQS